MQHEYTDEQIFESNKIAARTTGRDWISRFNLRDVRAILDALPEPDWLLKLQGITTDQDAINERLEQAYKLEAAQVPSQVFRTLIRMTLSDKICIDDLRAFASDGIQLDDEARQEVATFWNKRHALPDPQDDWQECTFEDIQKGDRFKVEHANWSYEGQVKWIDAEVICYDPRFGTAITPQNIDDMRGITLYRIPAPVVHPDPEDHPVIVNVAVHKPGTNSTHRYDYATWDVGEYYDCWSNDGKYYGAWRPSAIVEWSPAKVVAGND